MAKYHNKKTVTANGLVFDSRKEARRYAELLMLQKAGEIYNLKRQVEFELIPNQYEVVERWSEKTGKKLSDKRALAERKVCYIADFVYNQGDKLVVEDTKSPVTRTKDYIIKRKLMLHIHGIKIIEK